MQTISFRQTSLFKRGIWASAAAVVAFAALPPIVGAGFAARPAVDLGVSAFAVAFVVYFLGRMRIHRLADVVTDCGDGLIVRKGRLEQRIAFSAIAAAEMTAGGGFLRITVRLREPSRIGREFDFLPPASLWGSPAAVRRVAAALATRAAQST